MCRRKSGTDLKVKAIRICFFIKILKEDLMKSRLEESGWKDRPGQAAEMGAAAFFAIIYIFIFPKKVEYAILLQEWHF